MTGERKLRHRREDPHLDVPVALRRVDEGRLGEVRLAGEPLELPLGNLPGVREDGELVSGERLVGEHVADDVAEGGHRPSQAEDDRGLANGPATRRASPPGNR
jgi:hypothetical protein